LRSHGVKATDVPRRHERSVGSLSDGSLALGPVRWVVRSHIDADLRPTRCRAEATSVAARQRLVTRDGHARDGRVLLTRLSAR